MCFMLRKGRTYCANVKWSRMSIITFIQGVRASQSTAITPGEASLAPCSLERKEFSNGVFSMLFRASRTSGLTGGIGGMGGSGVRGVSGTTISGSLIPAVALCFKKMMHEIRLWRCIDRRHTCANLIFRRIKASVGDKMSFLSSSVLNNAISDGLKGLVALP